MAQCPLCAKEVKDDFGLIECEGCGAQLLVHVDGRVEYQGASEAAAPAGDVEPTMHFTPVNEETRAFEFEEPAREINLDSDIESLNAREDAEAGIEPPVESPGALEYDFGDEATADPAPPPYQSASSLSSPDLSDVARFGNSDISGGRDGTLRYKVTVEGVDTSDVRMAFREALTDRKFVWDIDQILRSMRHGQVTIDNVTPSKAFMLISRLRNLPVRVTWEQYAVHQT